MAGRSEPFSHSVRRRLFYQAAARVSEFVTPALFVKSDNTWAIMEFTQERRDIAIAHGARVFVWDDGEWRDCCGSATN